MLLLFSRSSEDPFTQFAHTQIIFHHYLPAVYSQQFFFSSLESCIFSDCKPFFWHVKKPFNICYFWVFSCCSLKLTREPFWPCPRSVSSLREGCYSFSALEIFLTALLAFIRPRLKKRTTSQMLQCSAASEKLSSSSSWAPTKANRAFLGKQHYLDVSQEKHLQHKQLVWI